MRQQSSIPDPRLLIGVALVVFGLWLALEGALMSSPGQVVIAAAFLSFGWWLRRRGARIQRSADFRRWAFSCATALAVAVAGYVLGYFVLMDRHSPTSSVSHTKFESSFRWAPREWVSKAKPPYETPWRSSTSWNILYQPMDALWFHSFPRSPQEVERLRENGYYR